MPDEQTDDELVGLYRNSGNLEDSPGIGHNEGPTMDADAEAAFLARRKELMEGDESAIMKRARKTMLVNLLQMVEDGTATSADMANLRALLKDNGMILGDPMQGDEPDGNPAAARTPRQLPTFDRPEYDS